MIEINLLPEELKAKTRAKAAAGVRADPQQILLDLAPKVIPAILGVLICINMYLLVTSIIKKSQLRTLNKKWEQLGPQRKMVESFTKENELLTADTKIVQELTKTRLNWSEKLNKLSTLLPNGIWFNELSLDKKNFILRGSTVSLQKEELSLLKGFMESLKKDAAFFGDFGNLELSSIQRRVLAGYDVVDFVLTGTLK